MADVASPLSAPPLTTPFIQAGRITGPWVSWLQAWSTVASVVQGLQVQQDVETNNATTGGGDAGGISLADEAWAAMSSPVPRAAAPGRDEDGETRLAAVWASEVAELRALVVAGDPLPIGFLNGLYDAAGAAAAVLATSLQIASNLSDLASAAAARTNLGLGTAAVQNTTAFDAAGAAAAAQAAAIAASDTAGAAAAVLATSLQKASNLSDVASASSSRTNLGLGTAAVQNTTAFDASGAAAGVLATSLQKASNLSDLASAATARTNLGLGSAALLASSAVLQAANNLSDVGTRLTAQTNLAGAYASWTPTITASGSMTVSSPTIVYATFIRFGPFVHLVGYVNCVLGGTASNTVSITLPVNAATVGGTQAITGFFSSGANNFAAGYAGIGNGASTLFIQPNNNANFALATTFFQFSALYRVS